MDWQKLDHAAMRSPTFARASCRVLGAHLRLLTYLGDQERADATIAGCRTWRPRDWRAIVNITPREAQAVVEAGLAAWVGDDLTVAGFDVGAVRALEAKRAQGPQGIKGGRPPATQPQMPPGTHDPVQGSQIESQMGAEQSTPEGTGRDAPAGPARVVSDGSPTAGVVSGGRPVDATQPTRHRIDTQATQAAIGAGDVLGVIRQLGGNVAGDREPEWLREVDGLSAGTVAVILGAARLDGDGVREPSGFRAARARWKAMQAADRAAAGGRVGEAFGLVLAPGGERRAA